MRSALYAEGKHLELIITPENEQERNLLEMFNTKKVVKTFWGGFYACQGGWHRQSMEDESLIFLLEDYSETKSGNE